MFLIIVDPLLHELVAGLGVVHHDLGRLESERGRVLDKNDKTDRSNIGTKGGT